MKDEIVARRRSQYLSKVKCSWRHCEACFEGPLPDGWKYVCKQTVTGELVVVCPEHYPELLQADLSALLKLFQRPGSSSTIPRVYSEEEGEVPEETKRLLKGKVDGK